MKIIEKLGSWLITIFLYGGTTLSPAFGLQLFQQRVVVNSSELCVIPISPSLIGWEKTPGSVKEIEYSARMSSSPDLPEWLKYTYDSYSSIGYIYGVPPMRLVTLNLDVIGWNRYNNYDVRQLIVSLEIMRKEPMEYIVEMKIDNVNIRDLCIPHKMNELRNVLSGQLGWKEKNGNRVVPVYMASAVDIGENRVPLRPNEAEGVVIHFASDKDFSPELKKLQVEISPLWKLRPCPRDMKRTSVERHFRKHNFLLDWCSFRLTTLTGSPTLEQTGGNHSNINNNIKGTGSSSSSTSSSSGSGSTSGQFTPADGTAVDDTMDFATGKGKYRIEPEVFHFTSEIPERTYGYEALLATLVPGSIGGLIGIMLIALLWGDREDESIDGDRLFFEAAFRMLFSIIRCNNNDSNDNNAPSYTYHQMNQHQIPGAEDAMLISRDAMMKPEPTLMEHQHPAPMQGASSAMGTLDRGDMMSTPLPPQYSETHPNGAPALIYAV